MEDYKTLVDEDLPEEDEEAVVDPFGRKAADAAVKAADVAAKKAENDNKKWLITVFNFSFSIGLSNLHLTNKQISFTPKCSLIIKITFFKKREN